MRDQTSWSWNSQDRDSYLVLSITLGTGELPHAKEAHLSQGLSPARGERDSYKLSKLALLLMDIWRNSWELCPRLPLGKEDLEFVLFCFVVTIKAPHEPQKYRTRTPACTNKDPGGRDESTVYWYH